MVLYHIISHNSVSLLPVAKEWWRKWKFEKLRTYGMVYFLLAQGHRIRIPPWSSPPGALQLSPAGASVCKFEEKQFLSTSCRKRLQSSPNFLELVNRLLRNNTFGGTLDISQVSSTLQLIDLQDNKIQSLTFGSGYANTLMWGDCSISIFYMDTKIVFSIVKLYSK